MIRFNELSITPDNKCLIIDVSIAKAYIRTAWQEQNSNEKGVKISKISIDTQDTWSSNCSPSDKAMIVYNKEELNIYKEIYNPSIYDNGSRVRIVLPLSTILTYINTVTTPIEEEPKKKCGEKKVKDYNNLYFICVESDADLHIEIDCSCDKTKKCATVMNPCPIYDTLMSGIRQIGLDCSIPDSYINDFLKLSAILAAIKSGNYEVAVKYWKKFFYKTLYKQHKSCGCHG